MEIEKVLAYTFKLGDVSDPEVYAGFPISEWEFTDCAKWCILNTQRPMVYSLNIDWEGYGYRGDIWVYLTPQDYTIFNLKWGRKTS